MVTFLQYLMYQFSVAVTKTLIDKSLFSFLRNIIYQCSQTKIYSLPKNLIMTILYLLFIFLSLLLLSLYFHQVTSLELSFLFDELFQVSHLGYKYNTYIKWAIWHTNHGQNMSTVSYFLLFCPYLVILGLTRVYECANPSHISSV